MEKYIQKECIHHGSTEFVLEGRGYYRCKICRMLAVAKRRKKALAILKAEFGGKCAICGYSKYNGALQFHHLNPEDKKFAPSDSGETKALDKLREEARKCILLCANCHAEVEAGLVDIPVWPIGKAASC
jgi:5-methylcytosine-specific restriction endonuclease McrA